MPLSVVWNLTDIPSGKYSLAPVITPLSSTPPAHYSADAYTTGHFVVSGIGTSLASGDSTGAVPLVAAQAAAENEWRQYAEGPWGS